MEFNECASWIRQHRGYTLFTQQRFDPKGLFWGEPGWDTTNKWIWWDEKLIWWFSVADEYGIGFSGTYDRSWIKNELPRCAGWRIAD